MKSAARFGRRNQRGLALWAKILLGIVAFWCIVFIGIIGFAVFAYSQIVSPDNVKKMLGQLADVDTLPANYKYIAGAELFGTIKFAALGEEGSPNAYILAALESKNGTQSAEDFIDQISGGARVKSTTVQKTEKKETTPAGDKKTTKTTTVKETVEKTDDKKASSEDTDESPAGLERNTQAPRSSSTELNVEERSSMKVGGLDMPYVIGKPAASKNPSAEKGEQTLLLGAVTPPETSHLTMTIVVQNQDKFDIAKAEQFFKLIKAFK